MFSVTQKIKISNRESGDNEILQEVNYIANETEFTQELKPECAIPKADTLFLYFAVLSVLLLILVTGASVVWTSPVIVKITSNDTEINPLGTPATPSELSIMTGIPALIGLVGSLVLPGFADVVGRKLFLQIMGLGLLLSSVLLTFRTSIWMITFYTSVSGLFLQGCFAVVPIFITEICEDHNRAKFGCFLGLFQQIGHLFAFIVGPPFSVPIFTLLITAPAVPCVISLFFIPESPIYLLSKGKNEKCFKALQTLRSNKSEKEVISEINQLEHTLKVKEKTKNNSGILSLFRNKETRIGLMLGILPILVQHLSGIAVIMAFLAPFFNSAGTSLSGDTMGMFVGMVKVSCFLFTSFTVERLGRKRMLLFSAVSTGLALLGLGIFFYLKHINSLLLHKLQWLPLPLVLLEVSLYSMGLGPIPMAILHEMFSSEHRASAGAVVMTIVGVIVTGLTSAYPIVAASVGVHWALWMFSANCFIGSILIYVYLPETKGKSLKEIQDYLKSY